MKREELLRRSKALLQESFGDRFDGVILFGSEVRGKAEADSDIDLLVLLEGPIDFGDDLRRIINALYDLQLEVIRPLHAMPVDVKDFNSERYSVYRRVKEEGVWT